MAKAPYICKDPELYVPELSPCEELECRVTALEESCEEVKEEIQEINTRVDELKNELDSRLDIQEIGDGLIYDEETKTLSAQVVNTKEGILEILGYEESGAMVKEPITCGSTTSAEVPKILLTRKWNNPIIDGAEDTSVEDINTFDPMEGVSATDYDGEDITEEVTVTETQNGGTYTFTYQVTDKFGFCTRVVRNITAPEEQTCLDEEFDRTFEFTISSDDAMSSYNMAVDPALDLSPSAVENKILEVCYVRGGNISFYRGAFGDDVLENDSSWRIPCSPLIGNNYMVLYKTGTNITLAKGTCEEDIDYLSNGDYTIKVRIVDIPQKQFRYTITDPCDETRLSKYEVLEINAIEGDTFPYNSQFTSVENNTEVLNECAVLKFTLDGVEYESGEVIPSQYFTNDDSPIAPDTTISNMSKIELTYDTESWAISTYDDTKTVVFPDVDNVGYWTIDDDNTQYLPNYPIPCDLFTQSGCDDVATYTLIAHTTEPIPPTGLANTSIHFNATQYENLSMQIDEVVILNEDGDVIVQGNNAPGVINEDSNGVCFFEAEPWGDTVYNAINVVMNNVEVLGEVSCDIIDTFEYASEDDEGVYYTKIIDEPICFNVESITVFAPKPETD